MEIVRWTPFRELEAMERRMRRLFEGSAFQPALPPSADVYETNGEFVVELEVPGFEEKELDIEMVDHTLRVKGERTETKEAKEKSFHLNERLETSFERRFALPAEVDPTKVTAAFAKGVLEIHVGKTAPEKPHKVPIGTSA
jgi:HSP20 family protein